MGQNINLNSLNFMPKLDVFASPALRTWAKKFFFDIQCWIPMEPIEVLEEKSLVQRDIYYGKFKIDDEFYFLIYTEISEISEKADGGDSVIENAIFEVSDVPPRYVEEGKSAVLYIGRPIACMIYGHVDQVITISHTPVKELKRAPRRIYLAFTAALRDLRTELTSAKKFKLVKA